MNKVIRFIEKFSEIEQAIEINFRKRKLKAHNEFVEELLAMSTEDLPLSRKIQEPLSKIEEMVIEENADLPVKKRHLFKISEYNHDNYGKIWVCYVSVANPGEGSTKMISTSFIVAKFGSEFKIVAEFGRDHDSDKWRFFGGDKTINFYELGKPNKIKRLISPVNDPWSIEEFNKEI